MSSAAATTTRFALDAADRVAQRLDADPQVARIVEGPERPVEGCEEPDVEHPDEHDQAEHRADNHRQHAARGGGQQCGRSDDDEELDRKARELAEAEVAGMVWGDEGGPDEQQGQHRDRDCEAGASVRAGADRVPSHRRSACGGATATTCTGPSTP